MHLPKLDRIVDTYIKIKDKSLNSYISQLRNELIPEIRKLEKVGTIIWYSFLVHDHSQLNGRVPPTDDLYIHIRLGLSNEIDIKEFIKGLPEHFENPENYLLDEMTGIDNLLLKNQDWAYAWKILGEASEWVLSTIESHSNDAEISIRHIIQFMHFISNSFFIGNRSAFFPNGFLRF